MQKLFFQLTIFNGMALWSYLSLALTGLLLFLLFRFLLKSNKSNKNFTFIPLLASLVLFNSCSQEDNKAEDPAPKANVSKHDNTELGEVVVVGRKIEIQYVFFDDGSSVGNPPSSTYGGGAGGCCGSGSTGGGGGPIQPEAPEDKSTPPRLSPSP